jgi:hypothetical protein
VKNSSTSSLFLHPTRPVKIKAVQWPAVVSGVVRDCSDPAFPCHHGERCSSLTTPPGRRPPTTGDMVLRTCRSRLSSDELRSPPVTAAERVATSGEPAPRLCRDRLACRDLEREPSPRLCRDRGPPCAAHESATRSTLRSARECHAEKSVRHKRDEIPVCDITFSTPHRIPQGDTCCLPGDLPGVGDGIPVTRFYIVFLCATVPTLKNI